MTTLTKREHEWQPLARSSAHALTDARLQLHHAAQLVAGVGISYLPRVDDDSHTNMEWIATALASHVVGERPIRVGIRPHPFALVVIAGDADLAVFALHGATIADAVRWLRGQLGDVGLDPARYTLAKHYTIPPHPVADGVAFDAVDDAAFDQLRRWYDNADALLRQIAADRQGSPVRCWPHHFDIATLLTVSPRTTIGVGLAPGDASYDEPYWYVNVYPPPANVASLTTARLLCGGTWHTDQWLGAVLPGSRLVDDEQREQVMSFLSSAIEAGEKAE